MRTNNLSPFEIGQVSHFPSLSHGLSLITITNAWTLQSVNKWKNIQCCQLKFFHCSQHSFLVFPLFCPPSVYHFHKICNMQSETEFMHKHSLVWFHVKQVTSRDIVMYSLFDSWQAYFSVISWFSGNHFVRAAWRCSSSCEAQFVVSAHWSSSTLWGRCLLLEHCIFRKVDLASRANGKACLVSGSTYHGFFSCGGTRKSIFMQSLSDQRSHVKTSSSCANMLRHVWENAMWLEMDGGHFEHLL
jgi:hypothetical protein